jgi:NAD(P)-dependent dehydrogenase (short-subunit alcohol dehydrogenase family)
MQSFSLRGSVRSRRGGRGFRRADADERAEPDAGRGAFHDRVSPRGVIAVMSSEIGSIQINKGKWEMYSASKAAVNMLMKCFSARHEGDPRALLLVAPGWGRTEKGGRGSDALDRGEHSERREIRGSAGRKGRAALHRPPRQGPAVVTQTSR